MHACKEKRLFCSHLFCPRARLFFKAERLFSTSILCKGASIFHLCLFCVRSGPRMAELTWVGSYPLAMLIWGSDAACPSTFAQQGPTTGRLAARSRRSPCLPFASALFLGLASRYGDRLGRRAALRAPRCFLFFFLSGDAGTSVTAATRTVVFVSQ